MRAATYQVTIGKLFELVVRAQVEHLVPAMRHVEGGAQKDGVLLLPVLRSEDQLLLNMRRDIPIRGTFPQNAEDVVTTLLFVFLPVDAAGGVGYRCEDLERVVASWCTGRVCLTRVSNVKRHVF